MGDGYLLLEIETERSPQNRPTKRRYYVGGAVAFSLLAVIAAVLTVGLKWHSIASSHTLEVRPDTSLASKRGAGLLLTYVTESLYDLQAHLRIPSR